jgi:hypothetical protein
MPPSAVDVSGEWSRCPLVERSGPPSPSVARLSLNGKAPSPLGTRTLPSNPTALTGDSGPARRAGLLGARRYEAWP